MGMNQNQAPDKYRPGVTRRKDVPHEAYTYEDPATKNQAPVRGGDVPYEADRLVPRGGDPYNPAQREVVPALAPRSATPEWAVQTPDQQRQQQIRGLRGGGETAWGVGRPGTQGAQSTAATVGPAAQVTGTGMTALQGMAAGNVAAGVQAQEEKGLQNILAMKAGARQGAGLAERSATTAAGQLGAEVAGVAGGMQMQAAQAQAGLEESAAGRQDQMSQMQASFQQATGLSNAQMAQQNAQFNSEIDAQLATERDKRINELLHDGASVEIAQLQVQAEMQKAKADLAYRKWSDLIARQTELDTTQLAEEAFYEDYNVETGQMEDADWWAKTKKVLNPFNAWTDQSFGGDGDDDNSTPLPVAPTPTQHGGGDPAQYAEGGMVPGRASDNTDSVPARLTPGELVIPKGLAQQLIDVIARPAGGDNGAYQAGGRAPSRASTTPWYSGKLPQYDELGMLIREESGPVQRYGVPDPQAPTPEAEPRPRAKPLGYGPGEFRDKQNRLKNLRSRQLKTYLGLQPDEFTPGQSREDTEIMLRDMERKAIGEADEHKAGAQEAVSISDPPQKTLRELRQDQRQEEMERELGDEYWLKPPPGLQRNPDTGMHELSKEDEETSSLLEDADTSRKVIDAASTVKGLLGNKDERTETAKNLLKEEGKKKILEKVGEETPAGKAVGIADKAHAVMQGDTFEDKAFAARKLATSLGSKYVATKAGIPWAEGAINVASDKIDEAIFGDAPTKAPSKRIMKRRGIGGGSGLIHANKGGMVRGEGIDQLLERLQHPPQKMNRGGIVRKNYGQGGMVGLYSMNDRTKKGRK